jgi:hypothetical protein
MRATSASLIQMPSHRARVLALSVLCALAAGLIFSPIASAAPYAVIEESTFGQGIFRVYGEAIDQSTGDVYLAAASEGAGVNEYDSTGKLLSPPSPFDTQEGRGVASGVALDPVNGDLYVVDAKNESIETFEASGAFVREFSVSGSRSCISQFCFEGEGTYGQIASDAAGNIYFPNTPNNEVQEFTPEGALLQTITGSSVGAFVEPRGVALDSEGNVYVADAGNRRVVRIEHGTGAQSVFDSEGGATVGIDPSTNNVFVGVFSENEHCEQPSEPCYHVLEYSPGGAELEDFGAGILGPTRSIAVNQTTHDVYVGPHIFTQVPQIKPPSVTIEAASSLTTTSASINGRINPNEDATTYYFEYVDTASFGFNGGPDPYSVPPGTPASVGGVVPVPDGSVGEGNLEVPVTQALSGLTANTTYRYRLVATDSAGKVRDSPDESFTTAQGPPRAITGSLSAASATAANVVGRINPEGLETTYEYEYGTTGFYGQASLVGHAGSGGSDVAAGAALGDLTAETLYHYRLVAINHLGRTYGEDEMFTTPGGTPPTASTGAANAVTPGTASITATIETLGLPTNYGFQVGAEAGNYGPATGFGNIGPGFGEVGVTLALQNLQPGITYHYRVLASNLYGTSTGADQTFTTPGVPNPLSQPPSAPLIATPAIAFPTTEKATGTPSSPKSLTRAQKLVKALKACAKKPKKQRAGCQQRARKRYGPLAKKKGHVK